MAETSENKHFVYLLSLFRLNTFILRRSISNEDWHQCDDHSKTNAALWNQEASIVYPTNNNKTCSITSFNNNNNNMSSNTSLQSTKEESSEGGHSNHTDGSGKQLGKKKSDGSRKKIFLGDTKLSFSTHTSASGLV